MRQTYRIATLVKELNKETQFLEIRKRRPNVEGLSEKEKKEALLKQGTENLWAMYEKLSTDAPEKTTELIGLCCFIEPDEIESHTGIELATSAMELFRSKEVLDFFQSLVR